MGRPSNLWDNVNYQILWQLQLNYQIRVKEIGKMLKKKHLIVLLNKLSYQFIIQLKLKRITKIKKIKKIKKNHKPKEKMLKEKMKMAKAIWREITLQRIIDS